MTNRTAALPPRRIFAGANCDHGIRGGCTMCTKYDGQCVYGDCSRSATGTVTMRTGERRKVCARCTRVLRVTGMICT